MKELFFIIEKDPEGGYTTKTPGELIFD